MLVCVFKLDNGVAACTALPSIYDLDGAKSVSASFVPTGKPFKIIDSADLPSDRSQRDAWTVDEADLTDGVGA